ncbi:MULTISPECIES: O-antigen ligase family protein [unclassified Pseudoalteromonas]|uniref:O-antigen ligase family protein n=1 Tax=unclassified Pseudoalteromonas TaxID=194690 RepID=UPI001603D8E1|nr:MULTISPECIES: O-antigen ligase family protein [unclassified Pseudoalteromonas]MBB1335494.1 O-antigen ligase family protein [Pseudoalteromonas sp. SR41-6]MBB1461259.1 O-antigen ligase family protein [Pseudoalteromonas sp. SG41-8]
MLEHKGRFSSDYFLGILISFPLAYPGPPFYIFSFFVLSVLLLRAFNEKVEIDFFAVILLFINSISLILSSLIFNFEFGAGSFTALLGGCIFFVFFILTHFIRDNGAFIKGFIDGIFALCLATILLFFLLGAYKYGVKIFYIPDYRLWAEGVLPDWPNYIVFFFCCAVLLLLLRDKKVSVYLVLILLAAAMTTSRLFLVCLLLSITMLGFLKLSKKSFLMLITLLIVTYFLADFTIGFDEQIVERMSKSNDREGLFSVLIELWSSRPFLGYGVISLHEIADLDYASFHNSYLEMLVKGGGVGFVLFIAFILRGGIILYSSAIPKTDKTMLFIILFFFLFSSLFQNYLKHPHIMVLFTFLFYVLPSSFKKEKLA